MIYRFFQILFCFVLSLPAISQSSTNAKINFKLSFEGDVLDGMQTLLPESMETMISPSGVYTRTNGGMTPLMGDILVIKSGKYMINHSAETISLQVEKPTTAVSTYEKLNETDVILGYTCQKYKVKISTKTGDYISYIWVTDAIVYPPIEGASNYEIRGVALKITSDALGIKSSIIATEISTAKQNKKLFKIPKGYKKIEGETGQ